MGNALRRWEEDFVRDPGWGLLAFIQHPSFPHIILTLTVFLPTTNPLLLLGGESLLCGFPPFIRENLKGDH